MSRVGRVVRGIADRAPLDPAFHALTSRLAEPSGLVALVIASNVVGVLGALSAARRGGVAVIVSSGWTVPPALLVAVALALHTMMALAAWLVIRETRRRPDSRRHALAAFAGQLVLHALWWPALPHAAAAIVVALALAPSLAWTMTWFWAESRPAGMLLAPPLAWVGFVTLFVAATGL